MRPHQGGGELDVAPFRLRCILKHAPASRFPIGRGHVVGFLEDLVEVHALQEDVFVEFLVEAEAGLPFGFRERLEPGAGGQVLGDLAFFIPVRVDGGQERVAPFGVSVPVVELGQDGRVLQPGAVARVDVGA